MIALGDLQLKVPVLQGGMGVGVSLHRLAGAVAAAGGAGAISTAQIGFRDPDFEKHPIECNLNAIGREVALAKEIGKGGPIGVNIMVVTRRYEDYVKAAVKAGVDFIVSGAGLPMELPGLVKESRVKLLPIVSGKRALKVIMTYWKKHYDRLPDGVVVEGPKAGGHLGFRKEELASLTKESYDQEVAQIIELAATEKIPVFVAGGVYTREDLLHYRAMGAAGVQLATRFVTTYECDASDAYKQAYLDTSLSDIEIVSSPVGMPGRAIHNRFLERIASGERIMSPCKQCITTCNPATTPYCITQALINAVEGRCDDGLLFCGENAYRATHLEHVDQIMEEFRI